MIVIEPGWSNYFLAHWLQEMHAEETINYDNQVAAPLCSMYTNNSALMMHETISKLYIFTSKLQK